MYPSTLFSIPTRPIPQLMTTNQNACEPNITLIERIRLITSYIDQLAETDLHNLYVEIINDVFGRGPAIGWELNKLKMRPFDEQKYICTEPESVYHFLYNDGYIFKLCYKLLSNSLVKFNIYFTDIPIEVNQKIIKSFKQSYYGSKLLYHVDPNIPVGLSFNSFEYYMFHFALYGLKLTTNDNINLNIEANEPSVYKLLCLDYLKYFLPLEHSASTILPQLKFNVLSTIVNQKQCLSPSKSLNFIKKDVSNNDVFIDKIENSSWTLTSESTWRSELVAFFIADIWLNYNITILPSIELTKLIRCFIKHLHLYSNCAKQQSDSLKPILSTRHGIKIYQYLSYYMINWPQDFSFRLLLENWLCYIQPWRYEDLTRLQYSITECEMNEKWRAFTLKNLLCYTKLFYLAVKRFICIDVCSPRYSIMVFRMLKVFTHPYLLKMILDIEQMYINNQLQHKKWNVLLSEYFIEAEGPLFRYELMFSNERNNEYKLFYSKLQKSLDYVTLELNRFQEEKSERNNSSMFGLILTPRKNKISDYTLSEWIDIQTNLKSSTIFLEQIINVNTMNLSMTADSWLISGLNSSSTTSSIFNRSRSIIQSLDHSTSLSRSSRSIIFRKEWEVDPDFLGTLSYENDSLVRLSKYLRQIVECYCNSYILKYSTEETVLSGILRQTLLRPPMKIFSYEPRNDGSGKRVRTPKIIPPTISFRWIASYFTLSWILLLLTLVHIFENAGFYILMFCVFRIIYTCLKYLFGYAPPFTWDNIYDN